MKTAEDKGTPVEWTETIENGENLLSEDEKHASVAQDCVEQETHKRRQETHKEARGV